MNESPDENVGRTYAHAAAYNSGTLPVGDIHKLHYEQYGKKDGKPGKILRFPVEQVQY